MRVKKTIGIPVIILAIAVYFVFTWLLWGTGFLDPIRIFWSTLYVVTVLAIGFVCTISPLDKLNVPEGRIIAIVPVHNEEQSIIKETIESLLSQSIEIDEIHVIDDGSEIPMEHYEHPRVFCHWQLNMGKRYAEATVLRKFNPQLVDFILMVDSDTKLDKCSVESLMKAMSNPEVEACTGTVLLSNFGKNLLTKLQEFNYGVAFLASRSLEKSLSVLEITSGTYFLYRGETVYFYLDNYLNSAFSKGDNRLSIYSLIDGKVLYVPEAIAYTVAPGEIKQLWKQRLRWSSNSGRVVSKIKEEIGRPESLLASLVYSNVLFVPLTFFLVIYSFVTESSILLLHFSLYFLLIAYLRTFLFALSRPDWSVGQRILRWLGITPILCIFTPVFFMAARYYSLIRLKDKHWKEEEINVMKTKQNERRKAVNAHYAKLKEQVKKLEEKVKDSVEEVTIIAASCTELERQIQEMEEELKRSLEAEESLVQSQKQLVEQSKKLEIDLRTAKKAKEGMVASLQNASMLLEESGVEEQAATAQPPSRSHSAIKDFESVTKAKESRQHKAKAQKTKRGRQRAQKLSRIWHKEDSSKKKVM